MRTVTTDERTLLAAAHVNHHIKVEVEDADRTFQDLTNLGGVDWVESVQWGDSLDQPTGTATVSLRRDTTSPVVQSIAPAMGGSTLNRDALGNYAPLLDAGRNLRITTAVTAPGVAPVEADWKVVFIGRVDSVDWHASPVVVSCRDLGGWLVDAAIQNEKVYAGAGDGPLPVETVMGQILADTPVFGAPALYTPTSPGWEINNTSQTVQARKSVMEALQQDWALLIGWLCRYRWDTANSYRLTFFDPGRGRTDADDTFGPDEYRDVTGLTIADADVRNLIRGIYFDAAGVKRTRTTEDEASQIKYGVKFEEIQLAEGDPIDTDDEMDRLLDAAIVDLGQPFATHEIETLYYWPVEVCDLHRYLENLDHYDSAQLLGVVGYTHKAAAGEIVTTIQTTGTIIGAFHAWLRRSSTVALSSDRATFRNVVRSDTEDQAAISFDVGPDVTSVWWASAVVPAPIQASYWSDPVSGLSQLVVPLADGVRSVTVPIPPYQQYTLLQLEARRADLSVGDVRRIVIPAQPQLPSVITNTLETPTTCTAFVQLAERGESIVSVEVQTQIGAGPVSDWGVPTRGPGAAATIAGGVLPALGFEHDITPDPTRPSSVTYRYTVESGQVVVLPTFKFDRDKNPNILAVSVAGTVISMLGDTDVKSVRITRIL